MFEIEVGIPLPTRPSKFPFASMQVGDSFSMSSSQARSSRNGMAAAAKKVGIKIKTATQDGRVRVWRVA